MFFVGQRISHDDLEDVLAGHEVTADANPTATEEMLSIQLTVIGYRSLFSCKNLFPVAK